VENKPTLRQELIDWITDYKDAAERNALAEDPDESADYLISLIQPLIEQSNERSEKLLSAIKIIKKWDTDRRWATEQWLLSLPKYFQVIKEQAKQAVAREVADYLDAPCPNDGEQIYKCPRCVRQLRDKLRSGSFFKSRYLGNKGGGE